MRLSHRQMHRELLCLLACGPVLVSLATQPQLLELRSVPDNLLDRAEGLYTRWEERYFDGPVYKRAQGYRGENAVLKNVPVFLGPLCTGMSGGQATFWCLIQCDESIMMDTTGVQLPCGRQSLDSTVCPATPTHQASSPPPSSQAPKICEVLGHARRFHEFGVHSGAELPPATWWRMQRKDGSFGDAASSATGAFELSWKQAGAAPGERLFFWADRTLRSTSQPQLCMGAEGGVKNLVEGTRLILWRCGTPPYAHEEFLGSSQPSGGLIQSKSKPELCLVVRKANMAGAKEAAGPLAMVGLCQGGQIEMHRDFREAADGTLRLSADPKFCLRSGLDRPSDGAELRLEICSVPAAPGPDTMQSMKENVSFDPSASGELAHESARQLLSNNDEMMAGAMARMLEMVKEMNTKSEELMLSRISKLEKEVTALRQERIGDFIRPLLPNGTAKPDLPHVKIAWSEL